MTKNSIIESTGWKIDILLTKMLLRYNTNGFCRPIWNYYNNYFRENKQPNNYLILFIHYSTILKSKICFDSFSLSNVDFTPDILRSRYDFWYSTMNLLHCMIVVPLYSVRNLIRFCPNCKKEKHKTNYPYDRLLIIIVFANWAYNWCHR